MNNREIKTFLLEHYIGGILHFRDFVLKILNFVQIYIAMKQTWHNKLQTSTFDWFKKWMASM